MYMTTTEVLEVTGLSRAGLFKLMHAGRFPQGQRVGRTFVWPSRLIKRIGTWKKWQRQYYQGGKAAKQ